MNKLILATVLCFTALFFTNCDKNDNPPPSNTDYITKSSWKFSSAKAGGADVTANVPACFKDNTMLFVVNGTGTINENSFARYSVSVAKHLVLGEDYLLLANIFPESLMCKCKLYRSCWIWRNCHGLRHHQAHII